MLMWIFGIVGTLGIAGTVAACIFAPAVAIPIVQSVTAAILKCKPCLIALAIVAALFIGALYGSHVATAKCKAGALAAELRNKNIDLDKAKKSEADQTERANTIEAQSNDQREKDAAYIAALENRPACALDDSDIDGLPNHKPGAGRTKPASRAK
ncbi:MAG: hypothetical protein JWN43_4446 [Gammaproteobacteria bacterium]|nr:hypothetical protein [Gammaproteobacteria bacterium]